MLYPWQSLTDTLRVYTGADDAGCLRIRKSTSGGAVVWGPPSSRHGVALRLSSPYSELAAVTKAAAETRGIQSVPADFGVQVKIEIHSDATAAIGICKRQGLQRLRHLATADLWGQQKNRSQELKCSSSPEKTTPAT